MIVSLELCTHWVMVCFDANHYTAKAFYVLGFSIWGSGKSGDIDADNQLLDSKRAKLAALEAEYPEIEPAI